MDVGDPCAVIHDAALGAELEPDGEAWRFRCACPVLPAHGRSVTLVEGADRRPVLYCEGGCEPEVIVGALGVPVAILGPPDPDVPRFTPVIVPKVVDGREIVWRTFDTITPRSVRWLWRPYLPLGKVVLVAGAPGHGKSQLTAWLAAQTTRAAFFDGDVREPGRVVIVSAEDDLADTVMPRLLAVNADPSMVEAVNARHAFGAGFVADGTVVLPGDVGALYSRLGKGDVRLLVFDPVSAFFGRTHSTLNNQDVRDVLTPLKGLAEQFETTVVVILHLNKSSEVREWSARIAESHGFQAVARTVLVLGPDPDDPEGEAGTRKVLALPKSNLVRKVGQSMRLEIESANVYTDDGGVIETSRVAMRGTCDVPADELLMSDDQRGARREAAEFVEEYLGDGWAKVGDLKRDAIKAGVSWRTIERVRKEICKTAKEAGVEHGAWWIALSTSRTPLPGMGTGGVGDVGGDNDAKSAKNARTHTKDGRSWNGNGSQESQDRQLFDMDAYRRHRDAMLGESWEDDDA